MRTLSLSTAAAVILFAGSGCGGACDSSASRQEAQALVNSDAVVDLVRITNIKVVNGCVEIGCASQVPVSIVATYEGNDGPKTLKHTVEPPMNTLRITDFNMTAKGKIVLEGR